MGPRVPRAFSLMTLPFLVLALGAQTPFSSSADYHAIQSELRESAVHPSRLGRGAIPAGPVEVTANSKPEGLDLESRDWTLEVRRSPGALVLTNKRTRSAWALRLSRIEQLKGSGQHWTMQAKLPDRAELATLDLTVLSPSIIRLSFEPSAETAASTLNLQFSGPGPFFGLGERFSRALLDGTKRTIRSIDLLGAAEHDWTYTPVPFLLNPQGLGMYFDTSAISTFDLTDAVHQRFAVQVDHSSVDCYFFAGSGPKAVISAYTSLTGRTPLPSPWAFGVWICAYQGPDRVLEDARRLRLDGIPASAIWTFDVMGHGTVMGWPLWWTGYYPEPRNLTDQLHELGFKSLTYIYPFVRQMLPPYNLPNPTYDNGIKDGLFVLRADGKPSGPVFEPYIDADVDFTNPKNVDWWQQQLEEVLVSDNFDGWMEDFGDTTKDSDRFADGFSGRDRVNVYPLIYHKITNEVTQRLKPGAVEFSRSGFAGSQGFTPVLWGGDQHPNWSMVDGFPNLIAAGITAGLSGFAVWGPDIDETSNSRELWSRWTEFGALTPVMRTHDWDKPLGAINLWSDSETLALFRKYAQLHVSLFPYFDSYAAEGARDGLPIIRHLFLEFPDDPRTYTAENEYLLGDRILVAPVIEQGATTRALYLPGGSWVNYWTGQVVTGGRALTVAAPVDQIPLFVRAGSVIPFISPDTQTLAADLAGNRYRTLNHTIIWRIFPVSGPATDRFTLEDGTVASVEQDARQVFVRVEHSSVTQHEFVVPSPKKPTAVTVDGHSVAEIEATRLNANASGWYFDEASGRTHVLANKTNLELRVRR